ncbi:MAG: NADH:ubiquinone reductase (Na(+)-transporting) subunit C [Muribaculaceae bacterium]|nr:NADH:ubiquinone reductase (Na(+)-transporting) subunit C [Muribaculaceae bacterium]
MNKQGNLYTLIYIVVLVVVVGTALALTSISLKERQEANADADKMRQILASVNVTPARDRDSVIGDYEKYIVRTFVINEHGETVMDAPEAFDVNVAAQSKETPSQRELPVYECRLDNGELKYILPMYGAGLWGPIWGYVSVDADGSVIYGAYFAHQGETPGLGAEIVKPAFSSRFKGKHLLKDDRFHPVEVLKRGLAPADDNDYVDAISGGTITSRGVGDMIDNCLSPYSAFLQQLASSNGQHYVNNVE